MYNYFHCNRSKEKKHQKKPIASDVAYTSHHDSCNAWRRCISHHANHQAKLNDEQLFGLLTVAAVMHRLQH